MLASGRRLHVGCTHGGVRPVIWFSSILRNPLNSLSTVPHTVTTRRESSTWYAPAGFRSACAVKNALSHDADEIFALSRLTITRDASSEMVAAFLSGDAPVATPRRHLKTRAWRVARVVKPSHDFGEPPMKTVVNAPRRVPHPTPPSNHTRSTCWSSADHRAGLTGPARSRRDLSIAAPGAGPHPRPASGQVVVRLEARLPPPADVSGVDETLGRRARRPSRRGRTRLPRRPGVIDGRSGRAPVYPGAPIRLPLLSSASSCAPTPDATSSPRR